MAYSGNVETPVPVKPLHFERAAPGKQNQETPPHILLFSLVGNFGGVERFACNLGAELVRRNWDAAVVFPQSASQEGLRAWCQAENLPCLFAPPRFDINQTRTLTEMRFLAALVRRYRPDILHYPCSRPAPRR